MECRHIRSKFVDYIDGDLSPHERAMVDDHLAGCYLCKEAFDEFAETLRLCEDVLHHPHPVNRFDELHEQIAAYAARSCRVPFGRRMRVGQLLARLAIAAAIVLMAAAAPSAVRAARWLFTPVSNPGALTNGSSLVRLGLPAERPFVERRYEIKVRLGINGHEALM